MLGRAVVRQTVPPASKTVAAQKGLAPHVFDAEHTRFRQLIELRNRRAELNTGVFVGIRGSLSIARLARIVGRMRVCYASGPALHITCSHCCIPGRPAPRRLSARLPFQRLPPGYPGLALVPPLLFGAGTICTHSTSLR